MSEPVAVELAPFGGADVVEKAVEEGFTVKEFLGNVGGNAEFAGAEEVEEDGEAIGVAIDKVFIGVIELKIPIVIEHCSKQRIAAGVCEGCDGCLEDFASYVQSYSVFLNSHDLIPQKSRWALKLDAGKKKTGELNLILE